MSTINKFILRDVRCFGGEHEFEIRPLTFLIGENSTGKSTVLGCLQAFTDFFKYIDLPGYVGRADVDFNSEPYQMGAFADIARRARSKNKDFQLGIETESQKDKILKCLLTFIEKDRGSEPIIQSTSWVFDEGKIIVSPNEDNQTGSAEVQIHDVMKIGQKEFHVQTNRDRFGRDLLSLYQLYSVLSDDISSGQSENFHGTPSNELFEFLNRRFPEDELKRNGRFPYPELGSYIPPIYSISPIRSKPKRTYDPLKETETPDGSEIPVALMNLSRSSKREWEDLRKYLVNFGNASGLFSDISLRELGRSKRDPFQLQIKVRGPKANLMDVGYGISQVLPILVRIFTTPRAMFLLQQPEVHLHPKGQAELASLLVEMNRLRRNSFVIETHSDFMIDRVRIEIKKGRIKPDDVSLIYLEPDGSMVKVHNISFDGRANMSGAPESYRDFFLDEADELLGFSKD